MRLFRWFILRRARPRAAPHRSRPPSASRSASAVVVAIQLTNASSLAGFETALDTVSGRTSLEIVGAGLGVRRTAAARARLAAGLRRRRAGHRRRCASCGRPDRPPERMRRARHRHPARSAVSRLSACSNRRRRARASYAATARSSSRCSSTRRRSILAAKFAAPRGLGVGVDADADTSATAACR